MKRTTLGLVFVMACGDGAHDTSAHHPDDHDEGCESAEDLDTFVQGLSKTGEGGTVVAIQAADPAPPDVGENAWTLEITGATGAPLGEGAAVVVRPFMPEHGHGSTPPEFEATRGEGPMWEVPTMDLFMPGVWEVTVAVSAGDSVSDQVVFRFCLEG